MRISYPHHLFTAIFLGFLSLSCSSKEVEQPNILFIMSDDHTTQAIGEYGSRLAKLNPTPNIDALAKGGMRFDRVFCHNSICTPSRANIITGQYSQTNGVLDLSGAITPDQEYLPLELKKAGYQTAVVGKWHLKCEPSMFDYYCVLPGQGSYFNPVFLVRGDKPWKENTIEEQGKQSSDAITDISLEWLKNGRDKDKPFFLMYQFKAPHDPFENAPRYDSYLEDITIPEPENMFNQLDGSIGSRGLGSGVTKKSQSWGLGESLGGIDLDLPIPEFGHAVYQEYLKRYLRCVKGVDDNVKRIIDYLRETGELENTVIMYTGDQGFFLGEHDLMDKRWIYEESMRMPFIVHYPPLIKDGSVNDWLINNTDFAPTILELAGISETPDYMQGHSFVTALKGERKPSDWRTSTYYRYWMHMAHNLQVPGHFGIRTERYKLIFFYGRHYRRQVRVTPAAWEFYDLKKDPHEMNNLYENPEYENTILELKIQLLQQRIDLCETDSEYPDIQSVIDKHWND